MTISSDLVHSTGTKEVPNDVRRYLEVGEDRSDVVLKPHIDHPIGFIENEVSADGQIHHLLIQHVHQSSRSGCYDVNTSAKPNISTPLL